MCPVLLFVENISLEASLSKLSILLFFMAAADPLSKVSALVKQSVLMLLHVGILLLNSINIKKADRDVLGAALNKGHFELQQAPSVVVPATAAVWAVHSADSLSRTKPAEASQSVQDIIQRSVSDLGPGLFCAFDLMLPHAHSDDSDAAEACTDSILDRTARDQVAAAVTSGREQGTGAICCRGKEMGAELRQRVAQGQSMAMPCMTPEAMMMIQRYYALLRQQGQGYGQASSLVDAGTHTVASLLRMATACARLHLRNDVITMPDAVLAIYLLQESMRAKVTFTLHNTAGRSWLSTESCLRGTPHCNATFCHAMCRFCCPTCVLLQAR